MQRVLKPGGMAMIVFSHRSFIEKAPNSARFYKIKQTLLHFLQNLDHLNQSKLCWLWNILEKTATVTNEAVRLWAAEPDDGEGHAHAVCQGASGPFPRPDPDGTTWPHPMIQWSSLIYRWFRTVSPGFTVVLVQLFSFRVQYIYNISTHLTYLFGSLCLQPILAETYRRSLLPTWPREGLGEAEHYGHLAQVDLGERFKNCINSLKRSR
jgi:hypothetical protein